MSGRVARARTRIFSGIQPTGGVPTLGNYLGALREWTKMQASSSPDAADLYCVVDMHALTMPRKPAELRQSIIDMTNSMLACGIDPKQSILFQQSAVPAIGELNWILTCITPVGWLQRMTQWKTKWTPADGNLTPERQASLPSGLLLYPTLMAADILLYRHALHRVIGAANPLRSAKQVPVGDDQTQHLELARDIAARFNHQFKHPMFPVPEGVYGQARRVMSLRDPLRKMSKSDAEDASRINLNDPPELIRSKISKAVTDSTRGITFDPENRPGLANLLNILGHVTERSPADIAAEMSEANNAQLKAAVTEALVEHLSPIQRRLAELQADRSHAVQVLKEGQEKANVIAEETMTQVRKLVGTSLV